MQRQYSWTSPPSASTCSIRCMSSTRGCWLLPRDGHVKVNAAVRPIDVVMRNMVGQNVFEVAAVADERPVEAFGADTPRACYRGLVGCNEGAGGRTVLTWPNVAMRSCCRPNSTTDGWWPMPARGAYPIRCLRSSTTSAHSP